MHEWMHRIARLHTVVALLSALFGCGSLHAADLPAFNNGTWPFCPPRRPEIPAVENGAWVANPIDAFILAKLEGKGLEPNGKAGRLALLRRLTFDLTGLPPTLAEQQAFLADRQEGAFERVVDRLLDSPHYGERWAQHWLDVVRYAETDGFKADEFRPDAYKYRDYVIRAFNADLPYDRFMRQQLAGDELEPNNPDAVVATGLNRLYPDESNAADLRQRRQEIHDNLTETTALTFLGLTVGCAQCHDHKFDPITQVDYFRLQAFFATLLPRDDAPVASRDEIERYNEEHAVWEQATKSIRADIETLLDPKRQAMLRSTIEKFDPDIREAIVTPAEERSCMQQQIAFQAMRYVSPKMAGITGDKLKGNERKRYDELATQLASYDRLKPRKLPTAMAVVDASAEAPPTHRLALGNYRKPQEQVEPGFPEFLGASEPVIEAPPVGEESSGRRAALANWLCREDHPLTARVMVNRIWKHHFGIGIVATPNDFGAMGDPPTHPDLLDWLAVEFVARGWSIKAMHRLIVTSSTYRQLSLIDADNPLQAEAMRVDGSNRLLWHARRRRLEGEAMRDAMLALSGDLQLRMFGPSARPILPAAIQPGSNWGTDKSPQDRNRRSVYIFAKRNLKFPLLEIFDLPDLHNSCPQRTTTTTAPQALALLNGEFSLEQARHWSERLAAEHHNDTGAIVRGAWQTAFSRDPTAEERVAAEDFIRTQTEIIAGRAQPGDMTPPLASALVDFCHAIFNANEFLYID